MENHLSEVNRISDKMKRMELDWTHITERNRSNRENCIRLESSEIYRVSLSLEGPKLLSMYTVEQRGFLVRKYWQTGSFKACQTAFRTEFGERRAPSKCCIQKLIEKLETRGSRSNACRLLSLGPTEGQNVQKYTPHNRTTQRRNTPRDLSRQRRQVRKFVPELGETHSSVLGCERRQVSDSIMSRSCFASFVVCVYKFSSHYLYNIIFHRQ